jgi:vitellogenic carboxypeptidase-like protein
LKQNVRINKNRTVGHDPINFRGLAIGDGLIDPATQNDYGSFLYDIGLIDAEAKATFDAERDKLRDFIGAKEWLKAFEVFDNLLNGDLTGYPSFFTNVTGYHNYFNYLLAELPADQGHYVAYLERASTRRALHVGNVSYADSMPEVEKHLVGDMMQSVKPLIEVRKRPHKRFFLNLASLNKELWRKFDVSVKRN